MEESTNFDRYQIINIALLIFPISYAAFPNCAYIFTSADLEYRCLVPECESPETATYYTSWLEYSVPKQDFESTKCQRYLYKEEYDTTSIKNCSKHSFSNITVNCDQWVYESEEVTIVREFNLTCSANKWKRTSIGTFGNMAAFFGLFVNGMLSDRFGRKRMMVTVGTLSALIGIIQSFTSDYMTFLFFEVMNTFVCDMFTLAFLLGLELVKPTNRILATALLNCFFTFGEMWVALSMWLVQDWRAMMRVLYTPGLLIVLYYWLVPESLRWLVAKGRTVEVKAIIYRMSKINGTKYNEENLSNTFNLIPEEKNVQSNTGGIFSSKILMGRVLLCSFCWIANTFVYFGMAVNSVSLGGNKYLNFFFVSLVTIPAYFSLMFLEKVQRKVFLSGSFFLAGIACMLFHFTTTDIIWLKLLPFLLGKFAITLSFTFVYLYTAELFPTPMRHTYVSMCSMIARIGSALAPQTPLLEPYIDPLLVFGLVATGAAIIALLLPETYKKPLPDTIKEAENIGK